MCAAARGLYDRGRRARSFVTGPAPATVTQPVSESPTPITVPRSILLRRVLGCMGDHCHDDTPDRIARRLGLMSPDVVDAALQALQEERFVIRAGRHWQLTRRGWDAARADEAS